MADIPYSKVLKGMLALFVYIFILISTRLCATRGFHLYYTQVCAHTSLIRRWPTIFDLQAHWVLGMFQKFVRRVCALTANRAQEMGHRHDCAPSVLPLPGQRSCQNVVHPPYLWLKTSKYINCYFEMIYNTCKCPEYFPPKLRHGHKNGVLLNTKKVGFIVFLKL